MIRNKTSFDIDGVSYIVKKPDAATQFKANVVRSRAFHEALRGGAILRERVTQALKEQGLLDDAKIQEITDIQKRLEENSRKVPDASGKVRLAGVTREQARDAALRMRADRYLLRLLNLERNALESHTVEGLAENARFDFLVSTCTFDAEGKPVFDSVEDYQDRAARNDPVAERAATTFAYLNNDLDPDYEKTFPENRYLAQIGFDQPVEAQPEETFDLADPVPGETPA